jgi:hypothetical protein
MVEPERYGVASLVAELVDAEPEMALADIYEPTGALRGDRVRSGAPRALLFRFAASA